MIGERLKISDPGGLFVAVTSEGEQGLARVHGFGLEADNDPMERQRLLRGSQALSRLRDKGPHPNLLGLLDGPYCENGLVWYVHQRANGPWLLRGISLVLDQPLAHRIRLYMELCDVVAHAHSAKPPGRVFHRDIHPQNVAIELQNGRPEHLMLTGFDLARDDTAFTLTRTKGLASRLSYVPPEQAEEWRAGTEQWERPDEEQRDLWALGMLLQFILSGTHHRDSAQRAAKRASRLAAEPAWVGAALAHIVEWSLADRPQHRPQRAEELQQALAGLLPRFTALPSYSPWLLD